MKKAGILSILFVVALLAVGVIALFLGKPALAFFFLINCVDKVDRLQG
jgi:hypothetical protein